METKSIERLQKLHPAIRDKAIDAYNEAVKATPKGVHPYITETLRSFERSDALYNQPWDNKDNDGDGKVDEADEKVSNAPGGSSFHNYGLAIGFVIQIEKDVKGKKVWVDSWVVDSNWMVVVNIFKKHGFKWGGDWKFKDYPHFEMTLGNSVAQLKAKYKNGDFIPGNTYLNIA